MITSSTQGLSGRGGNGTGAADGYVASKHALVGLMRSWAHWLAPHSIRVNTVHPTAVATPMVDNDAMRDYVASSPEIVAAMTNLLPVDVIEARNRSDSLRPDRMRTDSPDGSVDHGSRQQHNALMQAAGRGEQLLEVFEHLVPVLRRLDVDALSAPAAAVLRHLAGEGARRVTDLAHAEQATQPGMTQLVRRLERDGLLRRDINPRDGRGTLLQITDAGRDALAQRRARYATVFDAVLHHQQPTDQDVIAAALPALIRLARSAPDIEARIDSEGATA